MSARDENDQLTKSVAPDDQPRIRIKKIRADVLAGPDAGRSVSLPGPRVRVGSGPECELTLGDRAVSRHHMTMRITADRIRITDAGSRNGTVVDGLDVVDAYARPDSTIVVGETTLRLALTDDFAELPVSRNERFGALIGTSTPMRRLFAILERVAPTDTTVLIEGETGTGKELVAEALHEQSPRATGPFVVFDCSSVSAPLMESELFGHVRGAFTGAVVDRLGAFEAADGGTLFLDEIGELPLDLQPKLLRALERLEVRRVGTHSSKRVDVRIVAATHRSLSREVERGAFREDLYYRLAVVHVTVPPLRERAEDIPALIEHFVRQLTRGRSGDAQVSDSMIKRFSQMSWRGNVRELRNAVSRALAVGPPRGLGSASHGALSLDGDHQFSIDVSVPFKQARDALVDAFERAYMTQALAETGGNITRAAELSGVNRKFVYRVIERHQLRDDDSE